MPNPEKTLGGKTVNVGEIKPETVEAFTKGEKELLEVRTKLLTTFWEKHPELNLTDVSRLAPEASNKGVVCCL